MTRVEFACDTMGDHLAPEIALIDTSVRMFKTVDEAIAFISECTECLNAPQVFQEAGIHPDGCSMDLLVQDQLLLDSPEFEMYRE
tara:strand:+ start:11 stop:265 length:255 start_codon:yes stop_codon:yes gene_type:complete